MFSKTSVVYVLLAVVTLFSAESVQASLTGGDLLFWSGGELSRIPTERSQNAGSGLRSPAYPVGNSGVILISNPSIIQPAVDLQVGDDPGMSPSSLRLTSDGSDGVFHPQENQALSSDDWVFNFSSLYVPFGVTLEFARNGYQGPIYLLATEDVIIDGMLRDLYGSLLIGSQESIRIGIGGIIQAPLISLASGDAVIISGSINPLTPVPLPGAFWLFGTGLGTLALRRRGHLNLVGTFK